MCIDKLYITIYIYIYTHTHIYIYIYIYIDRYKKIDSVLQGRGGEGGRGEGGGEGGGGGGGGGEGGRGEGGEGRGFWCSPPTDSPNPLEEAKLHRPTLGLIYGFTQRDPPPPTTVFWRVGVSGEANRTDRFGRGRGEFLVGSLT